MIEANNTRSKRDRGRGGGEGLIMVGTYTQVENNLGLCLRYSYILREFPMLPSMEKILGPRE